MLVKPDINKRKASNDNRSKHQRNTHCTYHYKPNV